MSVLPPPDDLDAPMLSDHVLTAQQARCEFLVKRLAARLPPAPVTTGLPAWQLDVAFDPSNETAVNAVIRDLVVAVELRGVTGYVALPLIQCVENEARVMGPNVAVTLRRFYDVQHRKMVTRFYVAGV